MFYAYKYSISSSNLSELLPKSNVHFPHRIIMYNTPLWIEMYSSLNENRMYHNNFGFDFKRLQIIMLLPIRIKNTTMGENAMPKKETDIDENHKQGL